MRRQLSPAQTTNIVAALSLDPQSNPVDALKEALTEISKTYPAFTIRDFSSVWNARVPGFQWSPETNKEFYGFIRPTGAKGFWELKNPSNPLKVSPPSAEGGLSADPPEVENPEAPEGLPPEENLSRPWMRDAISKGMDKRVAANIKKYFPKESWEDILSEVRTLMLVWGENKTCDSYIQKGQAPTVAILSVWATQKIRQRIYADATDAINREFRGLRTQTEMRKRKELKAEDTILASGLKSDPDAPKTLWVIKGDDTREMVVVSPEREDDPKKENEKKLSMIRDFIRVKRKRSPERYARVFDLLKKGTPKQEAALLEGCSDLTISHLYQKVREDLKEAPLVLKIALLLLKKISEEPFSTLEEIQENNSSLDSEKVNQALEVLLLGNLITEARGKSFFPTEEGRVLGQEI